jgi:pyruvate dehydrogenase E1 component beta subunit
MAELEGRGLPPRAFAIRDTYEKIPRSVIKHFHEVQRDLGEPLTEFAGSELFVPDQESPLPDGETADMTHVEAVRNAMRSAMRRDPDMICVGEDIGLDGGCFKATDGFLAEFGEDRVIDSPLCETGIVGTAVGMSLRGNRVMAEIQLAGFVYPALDQILSHVSRTRTRYQGTMNCPVVIRAPGGGGFRGFEFHMDCPEGLLMTMPGTTIVASSSPIEAKGLLTAALEHPDPVVFLEPISIYRKDREPVPVADYRIPLGRAKITRPGQDVTVVAYGRHVQKALAAAALAEEDGVSVEVIDLRTIRPWDEEAVFASVSRTRRLVTVHDSHRSGGVGAEIAARVFEELFESLAAPIARVAVFDANRPVLRCESLAEIDEQWILGAVRRTTAWKGRS